MGFLTDIDFDGDEVQFEDSGIEKIRDAYDIEPDGLKRAWIQHDGLGLLQLNIMGSDGDEKSVDQALFDQKAAYLLYDWIATHIRERALILGSKSEYMVARILLRTALEARMTGIFMNSLADEPFRNEFRAELDSSKTSEVQRIFEGCNPWEVIDEIPRADIESTAGILDLIEETGNEEFHNIHNGMVRRILDSRDYFQPKSKYDIQECYNSLNSSVHAHIDQSLIERSLQQHGNPFESPSHSKEGLRSFLHQYQTVLDIEGVLMLNEFESAIRQNEQIQGLLNESQHKLPGLEDTVSKLERIENS